MNLRNSLKSMKIAKGEFVHDYFSRIHQIKEQIEAISEKIDSEEVAITAMNGLTRPWDAFIHMWKEGEIKVQRSMERMHLRRRKSSQP